MFSFLATGIKKYYDIGETLGKGSFGRLSCPLLPFASMRVSLRVRRAGASAGAETRARWARAGACADRTALTRTRTRLAAHARTPQPSPLCPKPAVVKKGTPKEGGPAVAIKVVDKKDAQVCADVPE